MSCFLTVLDGNQSFRGNEKKGKERGKVVLSYMHVKL